MGTRSVRSPAGRWTSPLAVLLVVGALAGCGGGAASSADCPAPTLTVTPATVAPGQTFELTGVGLLTLCDDTDSAPGDHTGGTFEVDWQQGDQAVSLGPVTTDDEGRLDVELVAPVDVTPGAATIHVAGGSVDVTVG